MSIPQRGGRRFHMHGFRGCRRRARVASGDGTGARIAAIAALRVLVVRTRSVP